MYGVQLPSLFTFLVFTKSVPAVAQAPSTKTSPLKRILKKPNASAGNDYCYGLSSPFRST